MVQIPRAALPFKHVRNFRDPPPWIRAHTWGIKIRHIQRAPFLLESERVAKEWTSHCMAGKKDLDKSKGLLGKKLS